jgi:hypothetical protein
VSVKSREIQDLLDAVHRAINSTALPAYISVQRSLRPQTDQWFTFGLMDSIPNVRDLLEGHITLELESIDRLYLNGYVPQLQHGAGLVQFLCQHRGQPIASPALLGQNTGKFVADVKSFAKERGIPLFHFERKESKDLRAHQMRRERPVRDAVVFIGIAQEKAHAFSAHRLPGKRAVFEFARTKSVLPNYYYFYLDDSDWGECFIKVCSYAPWGLKLYLNGHEWLKRQLTKEGLGFESLDNGFFSCQNPQRLQALADTLGAEQIEVFLQKWLDRLPMPLSGQDRVAGYDFRLSIWQMEFSLTQIVDRPKAGRQFFEEVIRDNLDLGRPDRVQLIFPRKIISTTPGSFRTRVLREGVHPSLHISYKHFDLKQYFKEGRGLRTEGTFHDPSDFGVNKGIENMAYLKSLGRQINRRLLEVERVSQNCGLSAESIQRVVQPTVTQDGQRAPGLKFGDPRVMALMLSLSAFGCLIDGFRSRELRQRVAALLGVGLEQYSAARMSYDLRRLLRKGIICRVNGSQRCYLSPYGWKLARLYARLEARVFRPALTVMNAPPIAAPGPLNRALHIIDTELDRLLAQTFPTRKAA